LGAEIASQGTAGSVAAKKGKKKKKKKL